MTDLSVSNLCVCPVCFVAVIFLLRPTGNNPMNMTDWWKRRAKMDKQQLERAKTDLLYFADRVLNSQLHPFQIEILHIIERASKQGKRLSVFLPRRMY